MSLEDWLQAQMRQSEQDAMKASVAARGLYTTTTHTTVTPPRKSGSAQFAEAVAASGAIASNVAPASGNHVLELPSLNLDPASTPPPGATTMWAGEVTGVRQGELAERVLVQPP